MKCVAFIPARSGSKRVKNKNVLNFNGHPLLAYSVNAAVQSGVFDRIICATDEPLYAQIAQFYGAEVPQIRPKSISGDSSPDIEWVSWLISILFTQGYEFDAFCILRPTSPFRTSDTIRRAWSVFQESGSDSIRAVEKCSQHPGKMWIVRDRIMFPLLPFEMNSTPWHSNQYAALPEIYVQNASLEISKTGNVVKKKSISGDIVSPFYTEDLEGFDINTEEDVELARIYIQKKQLKNIINTKSFFGEVNHG